VYNAIKGRQAKNRPLLTRLPGFSRAAQRTVGWAVNLP
jgi:hypothetical protein